MYQGEPLAKLQDKPAAELLMQYPEKNFQFVLTAKIVLEFSAKQLPL
jgi:hypothetical protein